MTRLAYNVHGTDRADEWRDYAACRAEDPEIFFPEGRKSGGDVRTAQAICHGCPVRIECGTTAIKDGEFWGVWGGMSQNQLRQQRRRTGSRTAAKPEAPKARRKSPEPAVCGTNSGHRKHVRDKTPICDPCRQAHADADARLRRTGTTKVAP